MELLRSLSVGRHAAARVARAAQPRHLDERIDAPARERPARVRPWRRGSPDPVPNSEVKPALAESTAAPGCGRIGRRTRAGRFLFLRRRGPSGALFPCPENPPVPKVTIVNNFRFALRGRICHRVLFRGRIRPLSTSFCIISRTCAAYPAKTFPDVVLRPNIMPRKRARGQIWPPSATISHEASDPVGSGGLLTAKQVTKMPEV